MSDEQQPVEESDAIVEARLAQAKARFGDRFDAAQWEAIRESIKDIKKCGDRLRPVPMANADEPEIVFVPYRADDPAWSAK
jgi:hypothetical protein